MADFKPIPPLKFWTQAILPLVYDDSLSYQELLAKVVSYLNKISANVNGLPDYIQQLIAQYISSGKIEDILNQILSGYIINVKNPPNNLTPAVGDGTEDDTVAIQGCIDYANSLPYGALVWFPSGAYLSGSLTIKNNVSIGGSSPETTKIVARGGITQPFISGMASNVSFTNIMLDGNMDIQVNNVNLFTISTENARFENVYATDGYTLFDIACTSGKCNFVNVHCGSAVIRAFNLSGDGAFRLDNVDIDSVSALNGIDAIACASNDAVINTNIYATVPTGISLTGNNCTVNAYAPNASQKVTFNKNNHNIKISNEILYVNSTLAIEQFGNYQATVSNNCDISIGGNASTEITGSRGLNVDGTNRENISQNDTKIINGTSSLRSVGMRTEQYDAGMEETITGCKQTNATVDIEHSAGRCCNITAAESAHINGAYGVEIKGQDVILSPTNPLTYKAPRALNTQYDYVEFKSTSGITYKVLVEGDNLGEAPLLNAKDYGLVGDGVTDNSNALSTFIDTVLNTKAIGFIPNGTYILNTQVLKNNIAGLTLTGESMEGVIFKANSSISASPFMFSNSISVSLSNFTIDGNNSNVTCLNMQICSYCRITNIHVKNTNNIGMYIISGTDDIHCYNNIIDGCIAENCNHAGIQQQGCQNCITSRSYAINCRGETETGDGGSGIYFKTPAKFSKIVDCHCDNCNIAFTQGTSFPDDSCSYLEYLNLSCTNCDTGIRVGATTHSVFANLNLDLSGQNTAGRGDGVRFESGGAYNIVEGLNIDNVANSRCAVRFISAKNCTAVVNNIANTKNITGVAAAGFQTAENCVVEFKTDFPDGWNDVQSSDSSNIKVTYPTLHSYTVTADNYTLSYTQDAKIYLNPKAAMTLTTITPTTPVDGQKLLLMIANDGNDTTVTETGNIKLNATAGQCVLGKISDTLVLVYSARANKWVEVSRSINQTN